MIDTVLDIATVPFAFFLYLEVALHEPVAKFAFEDGGGVVALRIRSEEYAYAQPMHGVFVKFSYVKRTVEEVDHPFRESRVLFRRILSPARGVIQVLLLLFVEDDAVFVLLDLWFGDGIAEDFQKPHKEDENLFGVSRLGQFVDEAVFECDLRVEFVDLIGFEVELGPREHFALCGCVELCLLGEVVAEVVVVFGVIVSCTSGECIIFL